jgi:anaerobic carbon-monoxide dehydrogenase, CODH/ACS complex subunit epsilon
MIRNSPWQRSNIPGPSLGIGIDSDVASRIIRRSKRPILLVGAAFLESGEELVNWAVRLSQTGIPVVATSHSAKAFLGKGVVTASLSVSDAVNLFKDEAWEGFDGKGNYDLVLFLGIEYWLLSQMASTLKNFAQIESINLTRFTQPNTTYSFPNLSEPLWWEYLEDLVQRLEKK